MIKKLVAILEKMLYDLKKEKKLVSKIKEKVLEEKVETEPTYENPVKTIGKETALGVAKDPVTGSWFVFHVKYDINDPNVKRVSEGNIRAIIWERFQIEAANLLTGEF